MSLEIPDLLDKIVYRRRGGYCFELNALYKWLLEELGYPVISYFARFGAMNPIPAKEEAPSIKSQGRGILPCDVGVGGIIPRWPIKMVERACTKTRR